MQDQMEMVDVSGRMQHSKATKHKIMVIQNMVDFENVNPSGGNKMMEKLKSQMKSKLAKLEVKNSDDEKEEKNRVPRFKKPKDRLKVR